MLKPMKSFVKAASKFSNIIYVNVEVHDGYQEKKTNKKWSTAEQIAVLWLLSNFVTECAVQ